MDTEVMIVGRYNSPSEAYLAATLLVDNEIECTINGDELINVMPLTGGQVTISVRSVDAARARDLLGTTE